MDILSYYLTSYRNHNSNPSFVIQCKITCFKNSQLMLLSLFDFLNEYKF